MLTHMHTHTLKLVFLLLLLQETKCFVGVRSGLVRAACKNSMHQTDLRDDKETDEVRHAELWKGAA